MYFLNYFSLYELRQNGVQTLRGGSLYFKLKKNRQLEQRNRSKEDRYDWRKLNAGNLSANQSLMDAAGYLSSTTATRKKAGPMDIIGKAENWI